MADISDTRKIYLDLSRLMQSAWRRTPSGIDRVELAYALHFLSRKDVVFVAANLFGRIRPIPFRWARALLRGLAAFWETGDGTDLRRARLASAAGYIMLTLRRPPPVSTPSVYLLASHHNLENARRIARFKQQSGAKFCAFVHDLIPITHPEYVRPGQAAAHRRRMRRVGQLAELIIVNSAATKTSLKAFFLTCGHTDAAIRVAPLGVAIPAATPPAASPGPVFICLATIEPRKNHLLLLHLWREFAAAPAPPRLILIGRRGWENEMVLDLLERCPALAPCVEERAGVTDMELAQLLAGARAVLLPSFAEGFGLPVAEALAAGVPVLCADLPALREAGGAVPEFLDPLDGPAWRAAILDYAKPDSARRAAQLARLPGWREPTWPAHFATVTQCLEGLNQPSKTI